jgi:hypothetical protein
MRITPTTVVCSSIWFGIASSPHLQLRARTSALNDLNFVVLTMSVPYAVLFAVCLLHTSKSFASRPTLIGGVHHRSLQQQQASTAGPRNLGSKATCPNNLPRVPCESDPCMRYPCPHGEIGVKNDCGKCSCSCSPGMFLQANTQAVHAVMPS